MSISTFRKVPQEPPVFRDAFGNAFGVAPVGPKPLLKDTPAIIFVPAERGAKAANIKPNKDITDTAAQNAVNSPLLRLPAKIRNQIFTHASTTDAVIELRSRMPQPVAAIKSKDHEDFTMESLDITEKVPAFPLLFTSRQLYQETFLLPFNNNTFHCTNTWDLCLILRRMAPSQRAAIKVFNLRYHTAESILWAGCGTKAHACKNSINAFSQLTGLEKIIVAGPDHFKPKSIIERLKKYLETWVDGVLEGVMVEMEGLAAGKKKTGAMLTPEKVGEKKEGETVESPSPTKKAKMKMVVWNGHGVGDESPEWGWGSLKSLTD